MISSSRLEYIGKFIFAEMWPSVGPESADLTNIKESWASFHIWE